MELTKTKKGGKREGAGRKKGTQDNRYLYEKKLKIYLEKQK